MANKDHAHNMAVCITLDEKVRHELLSFYASEKGLT